MDVETASAIEKVTERIDALETSLRGDIAHLRDEMVGQGAHLRGEMVGQGAHLRGEIATQGAQLRGEMAAQGTQLREEIAELRRHVTVLNESTRDDIRLVAEAVAVLTVKVDALRK